MADLIAIVFPDECSAGRAAGVVRANEVALCIPADTVAVVVRRRDGTFTVTTNHRAVDSGPSWGVFWGLLFAAVLLVPVLGLRVGGALRELLERVEGSGIGIDFRVQVRDLLQPGTSGLFLVTETLTPAHLARPLAGLGGTVLAARLTDQACADLQREIHGG